MGIDLVPLGRPKPGFDADWSAVMERLYAGVYTEQDRQRLREITLSPYEVIGAPQVGTDAIANEWLLRVRKSGELSDDNPELSDEETLRNWKGHYVLELLHGECDGVPTFSHGGLYNGGSAFIDETSFRGSLLLDCPNVLSVELENGYAGDFVRPNEAVDYGRKLLSAASAAKTNPILEPENNKGLLSWLLGIRNRKTSFTIAEQIEIVEVAGKWFQYWGERGHPIQVS